MSTLTLDGDYRSARLVGSVARVVVPAAPAPRALVSPPPTSLPRRILRRIGLALLDIADSPAARRR